MKDEDGNRQQFHPSSFRLHPLSFTLILSIRFLLNTVQQMVHTFALLLDAVPHEMNLRCARQVERKAELFADVRRGVLESTERSLVFLFISRNRNVNPGISQVIGNLNVGYGYHR